MYYLTPERMIESMKTLNQGKIWEHLAYGAQDRIAIQTAIERAYRSCVYPSDLTNPNFLDERIGEFLPDNNQAVQMKEIHMAALMNTYVGYHIEQNAGEVNTLNAAGNERANIGIVKFPTLVNDMPDELKSQTREELTKSIERRIEDIMYSNHSYTALAIMIPIERTIDEAIDDHSKSLQGREEKEAMQAYIKAVRKDLKNEMEPNFNDFNIAMQLHDVDWSNPDERKGMINLIKELQGEGQDVKISNLIELIQVPYTISSPQDLEGVREACEDFGKLKDDGVTVSIAFDISPEQLTNLELQEGINDIVEDYDNVERDYETEIVENGVDFMIAKGVAYSLGSEIGTLSERTAFHREGSEEQGKQAILNGISRLADSLEPYDLEREDMEDDIEDEMMHRGQEDIWS